MQHEITKTHALLDEQGALQEAGYAKAPLLRYDRQAIKAHPLRIKEWDYYLITCAEFGLALTIADNAYMSADSISLVDFQKPWQHTSTKMGLFSMGKRRLPSSSEQGDLFAEGKGYFIRFAHKGEYRLLEFHMENFCAGKSISGTIRLENPPQDSIVMATPFAGKPTCFYYNQKINCLPASGQLQFGGRELVFAPNASFGVLDWGRGVWPYESTWYWGSASGLWQGSPLGWNLGYGFGDTSAATENMIFFECSAHKLGRIHFSIPMKKQGNSEVEEYLKPWKIHSDDGRFEMDFHPLLDRSASTDLWLLKSIQHQVFGYFSGRLLLEDGREVQVKDFLGFAEKVHSRW